MAPCEGLIPDHIRSTVDTTDAEAWAIDGFGGAHAIAAKTSIGRNHDGDLILLASSVSREHAEITRGESGWTLRDLGSRNGTFVDGVRAQGAVALPSRARLQIGDVALWFLTEVVTEPPRRSMMATSDGLIRYQLIHRGIEMCIVATGDLTAGGALLWRPQGGEDWTERGLAPLEFQLLRALCVRAQEEAASPSPIRGCIPTKQLARELPFQSKYANEENVRQVVLRLRGVVADIGAAGMLAVAPGRGYYLACQVVAGALGR
ncbi:MAG TPA: FHA domain-containing protein [Kofleriaceae bacterium]|nr:FHA domain-containing protein [Kofleriaceae bacterium]